MDNKTLVEKISRLLELSEEEAEELYDVVDTLYNEYSSKYIEAILKPEENRELVKPVYYSNKTTTREGK